MVLVEKKPFEFLVNSGLAIEKLRISTQVRQTHLKNQGRKDPDTDDLLKRLIDFEEYVDGRIAGMLKDHAAYHWFSRVKGIGKENIAKVVGLVDIKKANTISGLWKFAGFSVENGKAPKRQKGNGKLSYNSRLRSMCWRLAICLLKSKGKFYDYYLQEKSKYLQKYQSQGIKVVPAEQLPKNDNGKYEPSGMISEGHVHNQALRKMIKLFLACLWLVWRESENLTTRSPYAMEYQGHTHLISPWEMTDR